MSAPVIAHFDGLCEKGNLVMLSETDKAWMAGFIDGEGCVTISRQVRKGRPSPAYRAVVTVSNTNREVLEYFVRAYGGVVFNIHERRGDKRNLAWQDAFDWYCPMSETERLLTDIRPFLRLKGPQADVLMEFLRNKRAFERKFSPGRGKGSAPLSDAEIEYREELRVRVQLLNAKGQRARMALVDVAQIG